MSEEDTHYETIGRILSEAGFFLLARNENAVSENGIITTAYENIVSKDTETDAEVNTSDISVYRSGEDVNVSAIDAETGRITLASDYEDGTYSITYHYSPVSVSFVKVTREDVQNRIRKKLGRLKNCPCAQNGEMKSSLRMITRLWSAGLLQTKDYGYTVDNEETAKDGYRKISEAKSLLNELYEECAASCGQSDTNGGAGSVIGKTEGNLFGRFGHQRPNSEVF